MEKNKTFYNPDNTPDRKIDLNNPEFLGENMPQTEEFQQVTEEVYLTDVLPTDNSLPLGSGGRMKKKLPGQP